MLNRNRSIKNGIVQKMAKVNQTTIPINMNFKKSIMNVLSPLIPKILLTPLIGFNLLNLGSAAFGVNLKPVCNPSATNAAIKVKANIGKTTQPNILKESINKLAIPSWFAVTL